MVVGLVRPVLAVAEELLRGRVERDRDIGARCVAGRGDGRDEHLQRLVDRVEAGGVAAFVADQRLVTGVVQRLAQRVEDLRAAAHRLGHRGRADRHDHALLELQRALGVLAAVDDVHHRHRQRGRRRPAQVAVERHAQRHRRGARHGQRHAQQRVGAEVALVGRAVELDQRAVDLALRGRVHPFDGRPDDLVDRRDRLEHALAAVARLVAVALLDRFVRAGRGARGYHRFLDRAERGRHADRDGRVSARVEDLSRAHALDQRPPAATQRFDRHHLTSRRIARRANATDSDRFIEPNPPISRRASRPARGRAGTARRRGRRSPPRARPRRASRNRAPGCGRWSGRSRRGSCPARP